MKSKYATIDLFAVLHDLQPFVGMRVTNVYDIDSRTYLLKLQRPEEKAIILFESGARIHRTTHDWPKSQLPSSFSMKFRKHINQKRLIAIRQLGVDRIVDMQFGEEERACHVIVELYDRGNVVLTDNNYVILNILRPRTDRDTDVRFGVREKYPIQNARQTSFLPSEATIGMFLANAKNGEVLRKALIRHVPFSSALLDHALISVGLAADVKIGVDVTETPEDVTKVAQALQIANELQEKIRVTPSNGYITYQTHTHPDGTTAESYQEYHPYNFAQFSLPTSKVQVHEYPTFSEAVDSFYSVLDDQKAEQKALMAEKQALKKVENVKRDHESRVTQLVELQTSQELKAQRIEVNKELVDKTLLLVRSAIANQLSWDQIKAWIDNLAQAGVPAAMAIVKFDFNNNEVTMSLSDPYDEEEEPMNIDIDIGLSAAQNCRKYFTERKNAAEKQKKTIQASAKALKNAQMQTKTKIDQVRAHTHLLRARKTMWFEKFYWFISSDKYLVIAGRDFQQNEQLVKRYLRPGDIYVHADIHGACSVVIRNKSRDAEIPHRTINEAGTFAICFSTAWDAKIVINSWWVRHDQVSRTAQTGEYLPAGSFMIRGKKNFIPASQLQLGFGLLFRIDEESAERHKAEAASLAGTLASHASISEEVEEAEEEEGEELVDEDKDADAFEDEEEEEADDGANFPDIKLDTLETTPAKDADEGEFTMVHFTQTQKGIRKIDQREKYLEEKKRQEQEEAEKKRQQQEKPNGPITKRQKHKLNKIKRKYRDQDDEEREMRMRLLGSKKAEAPAPTAPVRPDRGPRPQQQPKPDPEEAPEDDDEPEAVAAEAQNEDQIVIDQLCPAPVSDDTLIYTVAVCGPYAAMQKFKYKVKITPGTGKRGKAAKMALQLFLRDKVATSAELNLIKGLVSDDHIASNIPAKVRVSAPQLLKMKK
uniref:NFACT-R_1 domain-containing protein n=1 Tax=Panagrellus redivivus TaxID=6233 RepID=A0A7E4VFA8_PANRE